MRTALTLTLIVLGIVACVCERRPVQEPDITETRTTHVRGTPNHYWTQLEDR